MLFGEYIRLMALVEYSAEEIKTVFSDYPDLEVCVYAAPTQTVIGGPPEQVDAIIARAESEGKFARKFQTKGASHTQQMDPLLGELAAELQGIEAHPLQVALLLHRCTRAQLHPGRRPSRSTMWTTGRRACGTASTSPTASATPSTTAHTTFLELAPNPVALMQVGLTTACSAGLHDAQLIATLARKQDEVDSMTVAMANLVRARPRPGPAHLFPRTARGLAGAPGLRRHPADPVPAASSTGSTPGSPGTARCSCRVRMWPPRTVATSAKYRAAHARDRPSALVKAAAAQVLPDAKLTLAFEQRAVPGRHSRAGDHADPPTRAGRRSRCMPASTSRSRWSATPSSPAAARPAVLPTAVGAGEAVAEIRRGARRCRGTRATPAFVSRQPHRRARTSARASAKWSPDDR